MRKLYLDRLKNGLPGVSETFGAFLAEAAMFCLEENGHLGKVKLKVTGYFQEEFELIWPDKVTEEVKSSWEDWKEATEYGATAIALLLILKLTDFDFFRRTRGGTDYILGKLKTTKTKGLPEVVYLEISGIWKETTGNTVNMRISAKKKQVEKSVPGTPAFIIVTEFGVPKTKIDKK